MTITGPGRTLWVADLDGTLLRSDGRMSEVSRTTIEQLVAGGTGFTVATARGPASTRAALGGLVLELPAIVYAGAAAVDPDGTPLWWEHFDGKVVRPLIGAALAAGVTPLVFWRRDDEERISWVRGAETTGVDEFLYEREGDPRLQPVDGWDEVDSERAFFVHMRGDAPVLRRLARMIRAISWGRGCAISLQPGPDGSAILDVTADVATKGTAVSRIAEEFGYDRIVAFGDGANDLPLFAVADESYAVAGATDQVKAIASAVIGGCDSDAVAAFLAEHAVRTEV